MGHKSTVRVLSATFLALSVAAGAWAQTAVSWHRTGNAAVERSLAGLASGPVDRVWFSGDGAVLYAHSLMGPVFQTTDLDTWQDALVAVPAAAVAAAVSTLPEPGAQVRGTSSDGVYALGAFVYRSQDGGQHWENVSGYRGISLIGGGLHDLAIAPGNDQEIVVAGDAGVFRSADGGRSWSGLNDGMANLAAARLLSPPLGEQGVRLALRNDEAVEWAPGEKRAWTPVEDRDLLRETQLRAALSSLRGVKITAIAVAGDFVYTGTDDGGIQVSADRGLTWRAFTAAGAGRVERFWVDPLEPRVALAVFGAAPAALFRTTTAAHVLHTVNGGGFWDDVTANLPEAAAPHGVTADRASGAIYVATENGVYLAYGDVLSLGNVQGWSRLAGLPAAAVMDAKLDAQGNQLWVAVQAYGAYSTLAPHRLRDPNVVSAADWIARAVAPGSLVSILGAQVDAVRAGSWLAPVLAATATESQIQIPFNVTGTSLALTASAAGQAVKLPDLLLAAAAPVIFVARDGAPMLLDAEKGVMLDAMTPAHSGARIQILATGLGRVTPEWPTGLAAPLENTPRVAGTVHVFLDRVAVEVTRAELAAGYIGFYLVEITIPKIVNYGPAELYLDVDGAASNRVRVYIEP